MKVEVGQSSLAETAEKEVQDTSCRGSGGVPSVFTRSIRDEAILVEVRESEIASLRSQ